MYHLGVVHARLHEIVRDCTRLLEIAGGCVCCRPSSRRARCRGSSQAPRAAPSSPACSRSTLTRRGRLSGTSPRDGELHSEFVPRGRSQEMLSDIIQRDIAVRYLPDRWFPPLPQLLYNSVVLGSLVDATVNSPAVNSAAANRCSAPSSTTTSSRAARAATTATPPSRRRTARRAAS